MFKKVVATLFLVALSGFANADVIFYDDFSPQDAGWNIASPSPDFMGELNNNVNVASVDLTHTFAEISGASLTFDLLAFRSLDPSNCCSDTLTVKMDGAFQFSGNFGFGVADSIVSAVPSTVAVISALHGSTATYSINLDLGTIASGVHNIEWSYTPLQSSADEAWGLDNVLVEGVAVPAPAGLIFLLMGLAGIFSARRA
ncbi:MAG: hypothetical protein ACI8Z1_001779 [Candidatus Azotimanducaceae bacterium]|jgi:hypothetical protein